MATPPDFTAGQVLTAAHMNAVGLWLVKSQTVGSGVSSVTVSNAFSADYDNYRVTYTGGTGTTLQAFRFRLGASTTQYYFALPYSSWNNTPLASGGSNQNGFNLAGIGGPNFVNINLDVFGPYSTQYTRISGPYVGDGEAGYTSCIHKVSASFTDFVIEASIGTITGGTICVYGYNNG